MPACDMLRARSEIPCQFQLRPQFSAYAAAKSERRLSPAVAAPSGRKEGNAQSRVPLPPPVTNSWSSSNLPLRASQDQQHVEHVAQSWAASISEFSRAGQSQLALNLYDRMQQEGVPPDKRILVSLLKACSRISDLKEGRRIHAEVLKHGYANNVVVETCLVDMYAKCGSIEDARQVFESIIQRDVISWNAMLSGYAQHGHEEMVLDLYHQMQEGGVSQDHWTFVSVLQACGGLAENEEKAVQGGEVFRAGALQKVKALNAESWRRGYGSDVFVGSILISVYDKCGSLADARHVFEGLLWRDRVAWNAMLAALAHHGHGEEALNLYQRMQQEGMLPNNRTFVSAFQAVALLADTQDSAAVHRRSTLDVLYMGKALHGEARKEGYEVDLFVANALVSMYGKCGSILDAQSVFDAMSLRDLVSWNAMLTAYAQHEEGKKAIELYKLMVHEGVTPDETTYVTIFQACAHAGAIDVCVQVHKTIASSNSSLSLYVASSLIHAYAKCSRMSHAQMVFNALPQPDAASWNALIAGYARQGDCEQSLLCYKEMQRTGVRPSALTFLSLISACSHAGFVNEGVQYFQSMSRDYSITPVVEHYVSVVDLLARGGYFSVVEDLLLRMPLEPSRSMWFCLLSACRTHDNVELGKRAFDAVVRLQPKDAAPYILMWNIYSHVGMSHEAKQVDELRQTAGAWKNPGRSWIDHEQEVHSFVAGEDKLCEQPQIHALLKVLCNELETYEHTSPEGLQPAFDDYGIVNYREASQ